MPFCQNCGVEYQEGAKFCPNCGTNLSNINSTRNTTNQQTQDNSEHILWEGKPSNLRAKAKGSLNTISYKITSQRVIMSWGLVGKKQEDIELVRIEDISVRQSLTEKLEGIGNILIFSSDKTTPALELKSIPNPLEIKEMLRKAIRDEKARLNYHYTEFVK